MKLKRILAVGLAVAILSTCAMTAFADTTDTTATATTATKTEHPRREKGGSYDRLLAEGTITQETYDKIKAYMAEKTTQKAEKPEKTNMLDTLLSDGVITQKDYEALTAAMAAKKSEARPDSTAKPAPADNLNKHDKADIFAQYVTSGVISEETATAIKAYMEANRTKKSERATKPERVDHLSSMLSSGVITQAEYDAIKAAMPTPTAKSKKVKAASAE